MRGLWCDGVSYPMPTTWHSNVQVGWLVVFNVPLTARSFRDGTPIFCPLRRMWSLVFTPYPLGIQWLKGLGPLLMRIPARYDLRCWKLHQPPQISHQVKYAIVWTILFHKGPIYVFICRTRWKKQSTSDHEFHARNVAYRALLQYCTEQGEQWVVEFLR